MHAELDLQTVFLELENAEEARQAGNEGRARVCARRAAGWAVWIYRRQFEDAPDDENALRNLSWLLENHPEDAIQQAAARLIARVGKDFRLPHAQDPLVDAGLIITRLLE